MAIEDMEVETETTHGKALTTGEVLVFSLHDFGPHPEAAPEDQVLYSSHDEVVDILLIP